MHRCQSARGYDQSAVWRARKCRDGMLDLLGDANVDGAHVHSDRWRGRLNDGELADPGGEGRISQHCGARDARGDLLQQLRPFRAETVLELHEAGGVAARPAPTGSAVPANTIGMVRVACSSGTTVDVPPATMTSGASATNSAARLRRSSGSLAVQWASIRRLRPSLHPNCCRRCTNAP